MECQARSVERPPAPLRTKPKRINSASSEPPARDLIRLCRCHCFIFRGYAKGDIYSICGSRDILYPPKAQRDFVRGAQANRRSQLKASRVVVAETAQERR